MSKVVFAAVFVALLATAVHGNYLSKECPKTLQKCTASVSANIKIVGPGSCKVNAAAKCKAWAFADKPCFDFDSAFRHFEKCIPTTISASASCFVKAVAKAFAEAQAAAACKGYHAQACAMAFADAEAIACTNAAAFVELKAFVGKHKNEGECDAKVDVVIQALAQAAASAYAKACADNSVSVQSEIEKDFAIQGAVAEAYATCFVFCDEKKAIAVVDAGGLAENTHG